MQSPPKNPRMQKLLAELRQWCDQQHGRQTEVARYLGVRPSTVNDWFTGRKQAMGEQALAIQEFLKAQRRRRRPPGPQTDNTL